MNNKKIIIILGGVLLLLIVGGGFFFLSSRNQQAPTEEGEIIQEVPELSAEEIGLDLVMSSDNRQVKFVIGKATGIKSVYYKLQWDANSQPLGIGDEEALEGKTTKGTEGEVMLGGKDSYESKFIFLGTQSANTFRPDTGVENIKIILKVTKDDGKVYSSEKSIKVS